MPKKRIEINSNKLDEEKTKEELKLSHIENEYLKKRTP